MSAIETIQESFEKQMREYRLHYKIKATEDALNGRLDMAQIDHYLDCMVGAASKTLTSLLYTHFQKQQQP